MSQPSVTGGPNNSVGDTGETAVPNKPFYRRVIESYLLPASAQDETPNMSEGNVTEMPQAMPSNESTVPLTQAELAKRQRDLVDAAYFSDQERMAEEAIKNPRRKLKWRPGITTDSEEWIKQRAKFRELLSKQSIMDVIKAELEDAQLPLLIPPPEDGPRLEVQLENAKEYKRLLMPGERFYGVPDNLLTKLTMLKFGFPVEPLTYNNTVRCDRSLDTDDPPDETDSRPPIERILFATKPLEFLDEYNERSFGYPMLRRKLLPIMMVQAGR